MLDDTAEPTLGHAVAAFLARVDLATQSRRSYSQTLNRVVSELGDDSPLAGLDSDQLSDAIAGRLRRWPTVKYRNAVKPAAWGISS